MTKKKIENRVIYVVNKIERLINYIFKLLFLARLTLEDLYNSRGSVGQQYTESATAKTKYMATGGQGSKSCQNGFCDGQDLNCRIYS